MYLSNFLGVFLRQNTFTLTQVDLFLEIVFFFTRLHLETIPAHSVKRRLLADPRSAGALSSFVPQSSLHTTLFKAAGVRLSNHTDCLYLLLLTACSTAAYSCMKSAGNQRTHR